MAICRFSDYQCDLYIYESALGIECYVARSRYENEPEPPPFPAGVDEREWAQFWIDYGEHKAQIEAARLLPIGLPADGTGEIFSTWSELLAHVREIKALGYQVPDWVIESIEAEKEAAGTEG